MSTIGCIPTNTRITTEERPFASAVLLRGGQRRMARPRTDALSATIVALARHPLSPD